MNFKTIMLAGALAVSGTASAQFANTGASGNADAPMSYNRVTLSYAPTFIGGETVNGVGIGYTYGGFISQERTMFIEFGVRLNYNAKTFDGMFGYSMVSPDDILNGSYDDILNGDFDAIMDQDWEHTSSLKMKFKMLQYSIPINFGYRYAFNENLSVSPYIGLNFKFNLLAQGKMESDANDNDYINNAVSDEIDDTTINFLSKDDMMGMQWKTFQMGWHIGADVNYKAAYLGLQYGTDFIKLAEGTNSANFYLTAGFQF